MGQSYISPERERERERNDGKGEEHHRAEEDIPGLHLKECGTPIQNH